MLGLFGCQTYHWPRTNIYVRVHKKLKIKGDLLGDDSDSEDNEIHFPSVASYKRKVY